MNTLKFVAHRGYRKHYPENTLIAVQAAIDSGAQFVEVDIQLTSDTIPIVFHDDNLTRMCGVNKHVSKQSLTELKQFNANESVRLGRQFTGVKICSLADLVQLIFGHPQVTFFIELKEESMALFGVEKMLDKVVEVLAPVADQCVLISFSFVAISLARKKGWKMLGPVIREWTDLRLSEVEDIAPDFVFVDIRKLPTDGPLDVGTAKLVVYEIDDYQQARSLAERGVEFIETFAVGEMLAAQNQEEGKNNDGI